MKELLGHRSVSTTQQYLGVNYADAREAVEAISLNSESYRSLKMYNSLKNTPDETLFLELTHRGYNLPSLRDTKTQAEPDIIKIG